MFTLLVQITYMPYWLHLWTLDVLEYYKLTLLFVKDMFIVLYYFSTNYLMSSYYVQLNKQDSCSHVTFISKEW